MAKAPQIDVSAVKQALIESAKGLSGKPELVAEGRVLKVGDGVVTYEGMSSQRMGEVVNIETTSGTVQALVLNLLQDEVGAVVLGDDQGIKAGARVTSTNQLLTIPAGKELLGRTVDPLGRVLDGGSALKSKIQQPVEAPAPDVMSRKSVHQPLATGLVAIDAVTPIGRGQRQLIIGDRGTGKTAIAIDAMINQSKQDSGVISIYVAIGQKMSRVAQLTEKLRQAGALDSSIIVAAGASDAAALQYLAPYAATAIAEEIRDNGGDALIIYDDLTKHAQAYRQLSLLLRRPPGREAFPGDVFYLHSRLLERSAKLNDEHGGGSLTALPIIETQAGDVSAYIPTNVISITDGQIFLDTDLFYQGTRPAINVGLSVSRVGGAAQPPVIKKLAGSLRINLAQYREVASFGQFSSDLDAETKQRLVRGERMTAILKQPQYSPLGVAEQAILLLAGEEGLLDKVELADMTDATRAILHALQKDSKLMTHINKGEKLSSTDKKALLEYATKAVSPYTKSGEAQ